MLKVTFSLFFALALGFLALLSFAWQELDPLIQLYLFINGSACTAACLVIALVVRPLLESKSNIED